MTAMMINGPDKTARRNVMNKKGCEMRTGGTIAPISYFEKKKLTYQEFIRLFSFRKRADLFKIHPKEQTMEMLTQSALSQLEEEIKTDAASAPQDIKGHFLQRLASCEGGHRRSHQDH
jgi:hypothetical protein